MEAAHAAPKPFAVLESVRCLECGEIYSKPLAGGTVEKNPGCPSCGYVGWIPISLPEEPRRRFAAGQRQRRLARSR
jgi:predicted  nucleic acid-binding Zn-ribbon protein